VAIKTLTLVGFFVVMEGITPHGSLQYKDAITILFSCVLLETTEVQKVGILSPEHCLLVLHPAHLQPCKARERASPCWVSLLSSIKICFGLVNISNIAIRYIYTENNLLVLLYQSH